MSKSIHAMLAVFFLFAVGLSGCGGGSGSSSPTSTTSSGNTTPAASIVSGVAAAGTPIAGTVYLIDASSPAKTLSTTINADGSFSFDVTGLTAPYFLKAVGTANGQNYTLYSLAGAAGTANINPLSNLAVVRANGGVDPAALYAAPTATQLQTLQAALASSISQIQTLLQQILSQYGVASTNFITDTYTANHTGLDLLFDFVAVVVNNGTVIITNKNTLAPILTTSLTGTTLSGQITTANIPTMPTIANGSVYIYPSTVSVAVSGTIKFYGIAIGTTNQSLTWSVVESNGGSITSAGVYTAPAAAGTYHVKAMSAATSQSATATISVTAASGTVNNIGSTWKTDSSVSPSITVHVGNYINITSQSVANFYAGSIQCSVLNNGGVSFTTMVPPTSNYIGIVNVLGQSVTVISANDGTYSLTISVYGDITSTTSTTLSDATIVIYNNITNTTVYSGDANLIKQ